MAMDGELVMYVCQSSEAKVTKKVAWGGYAYTKRRVIGDVSYWYCDQRKICGASVIERNGVFTRKEENSNGKADSLRISGKGGWDADGNHATHPPNLERIESEISRRARRLEKKQRLKAKRAARDARIVCQQGNEDCTPLSPTQNSDGGTGDVIEPWEDETEADIRIETVWGQDLFTIASTSTNSSNFINAPQATKPTVGKTDNAVLIDTDGGCYDAWALFLSLSSTARAVCKNFKIVGITTVNGCTTVDHAVLNVTRVLQTAGKRVPLYKGMESPLLGTAESTPRPPFFGSDGFGDPTDLPPLSHEPKVESDNAVNAIIKMAEKYKGRLTILALGPLTNLAMAVKLKPEIRKYVKEIFIMGGNAEGVGNMTVASEFNFYVDPEAAEIVLRNFNSCPLYILPWETCMKTATSEYNFRMDMIGTSGTPEVELLNKIEATILSKYNDEWIAPDAVLVACFLNRQIMRKTDQYHCTVELQGSHTRGMMVVDKNFVRQKPANVTLISEVDLTLYERMLLSAIAGKEGHDQVRPIPAQQQPYLKMSQNYF